MRNKGNLRVLILLFIVRIEGSPVLLLNYGQGFIPSPHGILLPPQEQQVSGIPQIDKRMDTNEEPVKKNEGTIISSFTFPGPLPFASYHLNFPSLSPTSKEDTSENGTKRVPRTASFSNEGNQGMLITNPPFLIPSYASLPESANGNLRMEGRENNQNANPQFQQIAQPLRPMQHTNGNIEMKENNQNQMQVSQPAMAMPMQMMDPFISHNPKQPMSFQFPILKSQPGNFPQTQSQSHPGQQTPVIPMQPLPQQMPFQQNSQQRTSVSNDNQPQSYPQNNPIIPMQPLPQPQMQQYNSQQWTPITKVTPGTNNIMRQENSHPNQQHPNQGLTTPMQPFPQPQMQQLNPQQQMNSQQQLNPQKQFQHYSQQWALMNNGNASSTTEFQYQPHPQTPSQIQYTAEPLTPELEKELMKEVMIHIPVKNWDEGSLKVSMPEINSLVSQHQFNYENSQSLQNFDTPILTEGMSLSKFYSGVSNYAPSYNNYHMKSATAKTVRFEQKIAPNEYSVQFQTTNGINSKEEGHFEPVLIPAKIGAQPGMENYLHSNYNSNGYESEPKVGVAHVKTGEVTWTSPECIVFTLRYVADERGYRPTIQESLASPETCVKYGNPEYHQENTNIY